MDNEIRDQAAGRHGSESGPAHNPVAPPDRTEAGSSAPSVRLCQWCKDFRIQGMPDRRGILSITFRGGQTVGDDRLPVRGWGALWAHGDKSEWLIVQDGICEGCADALKNGRVISEGSTTL